MPSGKFVYAANATSWIVFALSGAPLTENLARLVLDVLLGDLEQVRGELPRLLAAACERPSPWRRPTVGVERDA